MLCSGLESELRSHPARLLERPPRVSLSLVCSNLSIGGLERSVYDTIMALAAHQSYYCEVQQRIYLLANRANEYELSGLDKSIVRLGGLGSREDQLQMLATDLREQGQSRLFTHGLDLRNLRQLWSLGISTIPVIHNASQSWSDDVGELDHPLCKGLVAVSQAIRDELRAAGWKRPVQVLRHDLQHWYTETEVAEHRERIRRLHAVPENVFLIGMVGHFKAHKAYTRAARALAELLPIVPKAHLMVIGSWGEKFGRSSESYQAFCALALRLGVLQNITCLGPLTEVNAYYPAFDVLLNTSLYEGVSVSSMQAIRCGCPVVSSDVGGQAEIVRGHGTVVPAAASSKEYAQVLEKVYRRRSAVRRVQPCVEPVAVPRLWPMLNEYGFDRSLRKHRGGGVLFLTDNLNHGGPQRSLLNLLATQNKHSDDYLLLLENVSSQCFHQKLIETTVPWSSLPLGLDPSAQVNAICSFLRFRKLETVCFWNVDARVKLCLAKMLQNSDLRLVDISPGPMLFDELDRCQEYAKKISTSSRAYLSRLDCFVAKYEEGVIPGRYHASARTTAIIPNGVKEPQMSHLAVGTQNGPGPHGAEFRLVTSGRIVPSKQLGFMFQSIALVKREFPKVSLSIAGGVDHRHRRYFDELQATVRDLDLTDNIFFLGPCPDIIDCLMRFRAFFMISSWQGCPNASLEAMASGLPVVANDDGGTKEQVIHGQTGFLISGRDPEEAAWALCKLLEDPAQAQSMGERGRQRAVAEFSLDKMAQRYRAVLRRS